MRRRVGAFSGSRETLIKRLLTPFFWLAVVSVVCILAAELLGEYMSRLSVGESNTTAIVVLVPSLLGTLWGLSITGYVFFLGDKAKEAKNKDMKVVIACVVDAQFRIFLLLTFMTILEIVLSFFVLGIANGPLDSLHKRFYKYLLLLGGVADLCALAWFVVRLVSPDTISNTIIRLIVAEVGKTKRCVQVELVRDRLRNFSRDFVASNDKNAIRRKTSAGPYSNEHYKRAQRLISMGKLLRYINRDEIDASILDEIRDIEVEVRSRHTI